MSRNLTPELVATGSAETRIGQLRWREYGGPREAVGERTLLFVHGLLTNSECLGRSDTESLTRFSVYNPRYSLGESHYSRPRRCSPQRC